MACDCSGKITHATTALLQIEYMPKTMVHMDSAIHQNPSDHDNSHAR